MQNYNVLIVGGGISGLMAAYRLRQHNKYISIAIIDKGKLKQIKSIGSLKSQNAQTFAFKVNYPNFVGKLIINQFNIKCEIAGQNVLCQMQEKDIPKVADFLFSKKIPIFGISQVTKSLENLYLDIINGNN